MYLLSLEVAGLQYLVLHLDVCVYKSFCAAPGRIRLQELVLHLDVLSLR
jgi:hypothetical protein